ncbi:MAG: hypothetical protein IJD81_00445 [Oscillospiraceae bacterium]|nr:hypothetical protein [Oscillospiraceae bacterium]
MNKKILIPLLALCVLLLSGCSVDMTGKPYSEIEAYIAENPNKKVTYTVTVDGGSEPITLTNESASVVLTDEAQIDSLLAQADYLQNLTTIDMSALVVKASVWNKVDAAFPNADLGCKAIAFLGKEYPLNTASIDLSDLTSEQVPEAIEGMQALFLLKEVALCKDGAISTVSLDDAAALCTAHPDLTYHYKLVLFGQEVSTDMERLEYWRAGFKDEGLAEFRKLLPMMHKLTYLKLDWCGTTDEAMAQLRDDFPHIKVVWRIFFHEYNCLTDTLKIWANWTVNDMNNDCLKYCTDVKYLDLGHTMITHCEWARNMPDLEVVIMGDCNLKSIEPLRECPKITYLEIFSSKVTDLSPLEDLHELKYLNISNLRVDDITPMYGLDNLIKVNSTMNGRIPQEQIDKFRELQPQCVATFLDHGNPTGYDWRYDNWGHILPRYALLRQQIGYTPVDYSRYPTGYVTEEITYESTGITPPEAEQ